MEYPVPTRPFDPFATLISHGAAHCSFLETNATLVEILDLHWETVE